MAERSLTVRDKITATVPQFCRMSGLGKTKVFAMIKDGTLKSIKIGQSRLIVMESYWRIIEDRERSRVAPENPQKT